MPQNQNELKVGLIELDQQENSPYGPYISTSLNLLTNTIGKVQEMSHNKDITADDIRLVVHPLIKTVTNKILQKKIERAFTQFNADRQLEMKMLEVGISIEDYESDPAKKAKVDRFDLSDTSKEYAKKLALEDLIGEYVTEYLGPKYDVDGYKNCIMIATLRNDQDMLINAKKLTIEERRELSIETPERLMNDE